MICFNHEEDLFQSQQAQTPTKIVNKNENPKNQTKHAQFLTPSKNKFNFEVTQEATPKRSQSTPPIFINKQTSKECPKFMKVFSARLTTSDCGSPISGSEIFWF